MIERRTFIAAAVLVTLSRQLAAQTTRPGKVYRLGVLGTVLGVLGTVPFVAGMVEFYDAFAARLREHGFVEGRNLVIERRDAGGDGGRFPALAAELVGLHLDVIVVTSGVGARALKTATSTIPIVMLFSVDPVRQGLIASLARPGGNVTGLADFTGDVSRKRVELLKEAAPRIVRIAFISAPVGAAFADWSLADAAVRAMGLTPLRYVLTDIDQLPSTLATIARDRPDALIPGPHGVSSARRKEIAEFALRQRLPTIFHLREGAEIGGLMAYGVSFAAQWRRAADYLARILAGAKPAELPVEQTTRLSLVINLTTAKTLGLTIPQSLLSRADEVIG